MTGNLKTADPRLSLPKSGTSKIWHWWKKYFQGIMFGSNPTKIYLKSNKNLP
jgi:hypothetical protein